MIIFLPRLRAEASQIITATAASRSCRKSTGAGTNFCVNQIRSVVQVLVVQWTLHEGRSSFLALISESSSLSRQKRRLERDQRSVFVQTCVETWQFEDRQSVSINSFFKAHNCQNIPVRPPLPPVCTGSTKSRA